MAEDGSERRAQRASGTVESSGVVRVIDLTSVDVPAPPDAGSAWQVTFEPETATPRRGAGHLPWAGTAALLAVAALVLAIVAFINFQRVTDWREYAERLSVREAALRTQVDSARVVVEEAEEALASAEQRVSAARREATTTHEQLTVVTSDVAALEARISALANEKARAEDNRWLNGARPVLTEGTALRAEVLGDDVNTCLQNLQRWLDERPSPAADASTWGSWNIAGDDIAASCSVLATDFEQLSGHLR